MLTVNNLVKNYESNWALNGISFSINKGEFFGLLGPNGAGKTTAIGIISGIIAANDGEVELNGINPKSNSNEFKKMIGVVPQEIALYERMSALENLMFWGSLYNLSKSDLLNRANDLLNLFGLYDRRNDKIKDYSGGMKRRINIASALLHTPQVLFMDEPTVGIDPQSRNNIFEVIQKLHSEGMTIVYTTHYMEEAEKFCNRIAIIDCGNIKAQGTLSELRTNSGIKENIVLKFAEPITALNKKLSDTFGAAALIEEQSIKIPSDDVKADLTNVVVKITALGLQPSAIEIEKVNLETIFLKLTGKQLRD
jgi:ABC-2 type transport system ATP-binding protein